MKTFGLLVPAGKGSTSRRTSAVSSSIRRAGEYRAADVGSWRGIRDRAAELGRQLVAAHVRTAAIRILMSIPGIGDLFRYSLIKIK